MRAMVFCFMLAAVGCASAPPPHFPRTFVEEGQDAWLHEHCEAKAFFGTSAESFDADMRTRGANFAELVAADPRPNRFSGYQGFAVKAFRCTGAPPWYSRDVLDSPNDL